MLASPVAQLVKNLPTNAGASRDTGSIPGSRRFPGEGNGKPLQYSCLENSMDRGAWLAAVHGVTKSQIWLSTHAFCHSIHPCWLSVLYIAVCMWYSHPPNLSLLPPSLCFLCLWVSFCFGNKFIYIFFLYLVSTYKWYMVFIVPWLTSHSMTIYYHRSIQMLLMALLYFYGWVIFHIPPNHLNPFICWWTFSLLLMPWLLQIVLQWTLGCIYLFILWFSPGICPGVDCRIIW